MSPKNRNTSVVVSNTALRSLGVFIMIDHARQIANMIANAMKVHESIPVPAGTEGHTKSDRHCGTYQDNQLLSTQYMNISFQTYEFQINRI